MAPSPNRNSLHPLTWIIIVVLVAFTGYWVMQRPSPSPDTPPSSPTSTDPSVPPSPPAPPAPDETGMSDPASTQIPAPPPVQAPVPDISDVILSDMNREQPGTTPTNWLYFQSRTAEQVVLAGSWDGWEARNPMSALSDGLWAFEIGSVEAPFGRYEFKFIVDGTWEGGSNRILTLNEEGLMEKPPEVVAQTLIQDRNTLRVVLHDRPQNREDVRAELNPPHGNLQLGWRLPQVNPATAGYRMAGDQIEFVFNPASYELNPIEVRSVQVASTFNGWNPDDPSTRLARRHDGVWTGRIPYAFADTKTTEDHIMFKFVVNGDWTQPPEQAPNAILEAGTSNRNLSIPRSHNARPELLIRTEEPIDLRRPPALTLYGLHESVLRLRPTPGKLLDTLASDAPMGVTLDRERNRTIYRLFAPRATDVYIGFFDGPYYRTEDGMRVAPERRELMTRHPDGMWEYVGEGLQIGQYYAYQLDGPHGDGEGFNPHAWFADPYAKAVALAEGNSIVMDLEAQTARPLPRSRVPWEDMVIYETHIRHLTQHPSSGVPEELRGTYPGLLATRGTGTGIDHLKELGVNVVQFLPIHEFNNGFGRRHDWGYATCFFFAPESSYATDPLNGSQVEEFKNLVQELHQEGFAVFLDVVYNHIGGINVFNNIDRKYYFRLNPDLTNQNFSGCGNDTASERPMFRRLIKESVLFWVEEYGIDGFRFDLAELIDDQTLREIEAEIREKHPHVVLHSEPWSFRGHHKDFLGPTSWGGWNDQFREPAKRFVTGRGDLENIKKGIRGSVESWTTHPLQSVNYMESHDDLSLTDELSNNPGNDGRELSNRDERIHKLASTLIFTSLGTPMITEGQAYLRSKHGIRNTYNQGDRINSLRWNERDRPHAREVLDYYKQMIAFRLSDAGRALRVPPGKTPSLNYTRFIEPGPSTALGWIVNANAERPNIPSVMVLMNAGTEEQTFRTELPRGVWQKIGDGDTVVPSGLPTEERIRGGNTASITVPPRTAWIYRTL